MHSWLIMVNRCRQRTASAPAELRLDHHVDRQIAACLAQALCNGRNGLVAFEGNVGRDFVP